MAPARRMRLWKDPALDRATNVGINLPSFNFVETPSRHQRGGQRALAESSKFPLINGEATASSAQPVDLDEVLYRTVAKRAELFEDPTMSLETKMSRTWQALLRHSERGRFGNPEAGGVNPICTALCLETVNHILETCGVSQLLRSVLVDGLANSIYIKYDPDRDLEQQQQYADVNVRQAKQLAAQEQEIVKLNKLRELAEQHVFEQLSAVGVGQLLQQMDLSRRVSAVTEMLAPVLDDELLLVLWNATATTQASATQLLQTNVPEIVASDPAQMSWDETRKRGATLASLVLQERVRLVILVWQRLSDEEKHLAYKALDPTISASQAAATLKSVLHALEETYVSELIHHQRQLSRRNLNLASQLGVINESGSKPSVPTGRLVALPPTAPRALGKLRGGVRGRSRTLLLSGDATHTPDPKTSIPQVLLGALVSSSPGYGRLSQIQLAPSQGRSRPVSSGILPEQLLASHSDVLRTCEDVFNLLCEVEEQQLETKPGEVGARTEEIEEGIVVSARRKLRDLLCTYVEPSEPIQDRFHRCEDAREKRQEQGLARSDDERKLTELMNAIISGQRRNPEVLVNAVNRSPETLLSAVALNPGMLLFAITKFPDPVKRFLCLDPKACDYLDTLVQKHKGVQLLWKYNTAGNSSHEPFMQTGRLRKLSLAAEELALALPAPDSLERESLLLLEWFTSHLSDLTDLLLEHPKPLQLLFAKMHQRGDVSAFYQLMLLLQQTAGVQNFISRASVATLERLALEDQAAVLAVLREIFHSRDGHTENGGEGTQGRINRDLLHELQASPHLVVCLSAMDPNVLQEVFLGNVDVWGPFFVDMVTSNDALLRQSLAQRTNHIEGSDTLLRLFTAVLEGTTATLDLAALDSALCAADVAQAKQREASARRKDRQCIYLRGRSTVFRAIAAPQIAIVGYNPRRWFLMGQAAAAISAVTASGSTISISSNPVAKEHKGNRTLLRPRAKKPGSSALTPGRKRQVRSVEAGGFPTLSSSVGDGSAPDKTLMARGGEVPPMWQMYLRAHAALLAKEDPDGTREPLPALPKARVKALVLDIWLEFLKVDHLQLETASLWSLAPFVCDYLVARYNAPAAVGSRLESLLNGLLAFQDDPRIAFFASACGLGDARAVEGCELDPPSYDVFLYYSHALAHIFYGQMKIYQAGKRLNETPDGSCSISVRHAVTVATTLFSFSLSELSMRALRTEIEALPRAGLMNKVTETASEASDEDSSAVNTMGYESMELVELDDVMDIFLKQWAEKTRQTEERYRQAFAAHDLGGDRIGLDEFAKIVTAVTAGRVTTRECRLVYGDAGMEFLNLETFLRVTRAYQLRSFDAHLPEVVLDEQDIQDLRLSVGRANVASTQREVEDLARYWRSVRSDVVHQLEAAHQKKDTKVMLKKQSALIEKLVASTPPLHQQLQVQPNTKRQPTSAAHMSALQEKLDRVWHEVRTCVKMLHRARLIQHYLSGLYIRSNMLRWIRQARKRAQEDALRRLPSSRLSTPLLHGDTPGISKTGSVQSIHE